jgi:hypothetical protein
MKFAKEQVEKLHNNGRAMEVYIKTEIMPYLKDEVKVDFGDMVTRGRYGEIKEKNYKLYVSKDEVWCKQGGLGIMFDIKDYQRGVCGWIDLWSKEDGWALDCLYNLSLNWASIKAKLNDYVKEQKAKDDAVFNDFMI